MTERANITPKVLKWARESAKISKTDAAAKVSVKLEKIQEWEKGDSAPSLRQAKILAKAYQRSFAIFFLPEPPLDFHPLEDFRKSGSAPLSTSSIFIIREIQQKQSWISENIKDNGENKLDFVGKFSFNNNPKDIADNILETLQIAPPNYMNVNPIKRWIDKAESKGIFVSRSSFIHSRLKLNIDEIQGFAIADDYAPFVFINSADWNAPQLFTLVHELAHIWIASTGISNGLVPEIRDSSKFHPVELFCNEIAANALIPNNFIYNIPSKTFNSSQEVFNISKNLGVSSYAFIVRALNLNLISQEKYKNLKNESDQQFMEYMKAEANKKLRQKKKPGGPSPYLLRMNRNSKLFTQIVLDAFNGGRIEPNYASSLLHVKSNKFYKLEERLYQ